MSHLTTTDESRLETWRFYQLAPSLLGAPATAPTDGPDVASRVYMEQIPIGESNALCTAHHYLHRGRTGPQLAYGVWYRGIGVGVIHYAYPRWSKSPYPEAPSPLNVLECARVYISNLDRHGYPVGNAKGRRIEGLSVAAFLTSAQRIKADWEAKYPDLPRATALVSWSDNTRHPGALYKLAGWRMDTDSAGKRAHGGNWIHGSSRYGGKETRNNFSDYSHAKSRWSLILDEYFLTHPVTATEVT